MLLSLDSDKEPSIVHTWTLTMLQGLVAAYPRKHRMKVTTPLLGSGCTHTNTHKHPHTPLGQLESPMDQNMHFSGLWYKPE